MANYADIKKHVLLEGTEEKVEVNQRHLIDKILARYSAEYTIYRELMQNSDDAGATQIEIDFQHGKDVDNASANHSASGSAESFGTIIYRNNGENFRPQDWSRLRTIAEGNPDEQKIGFFGVGFYSVFSVCEEPMVISGGHVLAFKWNKDQLRTMFGDSNSKDKTWTEFVFDLRSHSQLPEVTPFGRFLANAIAFTRNVRSVEILVSGRPALSIRKTLYNQHTAAFFERQEIARGASMWSRVTGKSKVQQLYSPGKIFEIMNADIQQIRLDIAYNGWQSSSAEPEDKASIELDIGTGYVTAHAGTTLIRDMARVTKKNPPSTLKVQVVYGSSRSTATPLSLYEEKQNNKGVVSAAGDMLGSLFSLFGSSKKTTSKTAVTTKQEAARFFDEFNPYRDKGRIFIGFATHQTTGASFHVSAPVIPTVERENIDFVDPVLAEWNTELLAVSGIVARVMYEDEHANLDLSALEKLSIITEYEQSVKEGVPLQQTGETYEADKAALAVLHGRAAHIMNTFTFKPSTPYSAVGAALMSGFSSSLNDSPLGPPSVLTSKGVIACNEARLPNAGLERFVWREVAVIPQNIKKECNAFLEQLNGDSNARVLTLTNLYTELEVHALSEARCTTLLTWWADVVLAQVSPQKASEYSHELYSCLKVILESNSMSQAGDEKCTSTGSINTKTTEIVSMKQFKQFSVGKTIPRDVPFPCTLLPFSISDKLTRSQLTSLKFTELTIPTWLVFVLNDIELYKLVRTNGSFAQKVLSVVSKGYGNMSRAHQQNCIQKLQLVECMPTSQGLLLPEATYLPNVSFFKDLPHVKLNETENPVAKNFLLALGVRARVSLELVLERLGELNWNQDSLLSYLANEMSEFSAEEWGRLKTVAFLTADESQSRTSLANVATETDFVAPPPYSSHPTRRHTSKVGQNGNGQIGEERRRYKASELFTPIDEHRLLGLDVLEWGNGYKGSRSAVDTKRWRERTPIALLLMQLGLNDHPPVDVLIDLACRPALLNSNEHRPARSSPDGLKDLTGRIETSSDHRASNGNLAEEMVSRVALGYLCDNYEKYYRSFIARTVKVSFLPCIIVSPTDIRRKISVYCKPNECYALEEAHIVRLPVLEESFRPYAAILGVERYPNCSAIVPFLKRNPPHLHNAKRVFAFLGASRSANPGKEWRDVLSTLQFIPVSTRGTDANIEDDSDNADTTLTRNQRVTFRKPTQVYFGTNASGVYVNNPITASTTSNATSRYSMLFDYVDFGPGANSFLAECGVRDEPTPTELARAMVQDAWSVIECVGGVEGYLSVLRECAIHFKGFTKQLKDQMGTAKCLLGAKRVERIGGNDRGYMNKNDAKDDDSMNRSENDNVKLSINGDLEEDMDDEVGLWSETFEYELCTANECNIIDDVILQQTFNPLSAPMEESIEAMYAALGTQRLKSEVKQSTSIVGSPSETLSSKRLQTLIRQRAPLLMYNQSSHKNQKDTTDTMTALRKLTNLCVYEVSAIQKTLVYRTQTRMQTPTACMGKVGTFSRAVCMLIMSPVEYHDVASTLASDIYSMARPNDALLLASLLETPLGSLRAKGFPIDRLMKKKPPATMQTPNTPTHTEVNDQQTSAVSTKQSSTHNSPGGGTEIGGEASTLSTSDMAKYTKQLEVMFPDCDRAYLTRLVSSFDANQLENAVDELLKGDYPKSTNTKQNNSKSEQPPPAYISGTPKNALNTTTPSVPPPVNRETKQYPYKSFRNRLSKMLTGGGSVSHHGADQQAQPHNLQPKSPTPEPTRTPTTVVNTHPNIGGAGSGTVPATPAMMKQTLVKAIKSCKPNSRDVDSGPTKLISSNDQGGTSTKHECEIIPGHRLRWASKISDFDVYVDKSLDNSTLAEADVTAWANGLAFVLNNLQRNVFNLPSGSVHMFYDTSASTTIAFNRGNSLFFNIRMFGIYTPTPNSFDTHAYWFMTTCHELAHAFSSAHDQTHGAYMSQFAKAFMATFAKSTQHL
eukprot:CFRG1871T1